LHRELILVIATNATILQNAGHNGVNGESVANHVMASALVPAPVHVDLQVARNALETILNPNHAMNQNAALVIGTYGVTALSHVVKDSDKGSVIVSVPMVKVPKTVADAVMNLWRIGNHVWTKNVLQSAIQARGNHGVHVQQHAETTEQDQEKDHVILAVIQRVPRKHRKKLHHANQRIVHHAHRHHVTAVFLSVINQIDAKKNVHHHHVTAVFPNAINQIDAKKNVNQKNQNVNGPIGHHSALVAPPVMKEPNVEPEIVIVVQILMNRKLIYQDQDVKETLLKKSHATMDHVKNANQETGHHGLNVIAKLNHQ
jgi:hypothetical protein